MAALLKLTIFVGLPPEGPRTPHRTLFYAGWVCWHPETLGAHTAARRLLTWPIEVTLDMKMRAKVLQRALGGGGGNRGLL